MAKITGLGWTTFSVADAAGTLQLIRTDTESLDFSTPRGVQDVTSIDQSAHERLLLLGDFSLTANGTFNDAPNFSHWVFRSINAGVNRSTALSVAGSTLTTNVLYEDYTVKRGADGSLQWTAMGHLGDGAVPTWTGT